MEQNRKANLIGCLVIAIAGIMTGMVGGLYAFAVFLCIVGLLLGSYVTIWVCFVCGMTDTIQVTKENLVIQ